MNTTMTYDEMKNEIQRLGKEQVSYATQFKTDILEMLNGILPVNAEIRMWHNDVYNFEIGKFEDNHTIWDVDFSFRHWYSDEPVKMNINFGVSGSFGSDDAEQLNKYTCLGIICNNFKKIEDYILNLASFKGYHENHKKISELSWNVSKIDEENERKERENKKTYFLSKLKVGSIIDTRPNDVIKDNDDGWYARKLRGLKNQKIEWMTKKNVSFEGDYGKRTKIGDVLHNLIIGAWKMKEEKTLDNKTEV